MYVTRIPPVIEKKSKFDSTVKWLKKTIDFNRLELFTIFATGFSLGIILSLILL